MPSVTGSTRAEPSIEPSIQQARSGDASPIHLPPAQPAPRRRALSSWAQSRLVRIASVLVGLGIWETAGLTGVADVEFVSRPTRVVGALPGLVEDGFLADVQPTATAVLYAMILALIIGVMIGYVTGIQRWVRQALELLVTIGFTTPMTAIVPVAVSILGLGVTSRVVIGCFAGVFPLVVNVCAGVQALDPALDRLGRAYRIGRTKMITWVRLPGIVHYVVAGARIAFGRVLIGVIVAEMMGGASHGVGLRLIRLGQFHRTDSLLAVTITVGLTGTVVVTALRVLENRSLRWRQP